MKSTYIVLVVTTQRWRKTSSVFLYEKQKAARAGLCYAYRRLFAFGKHRNGAYELIKAWFKRVDVTPI